MNETREQQAKLLDNMAQWLSSPMWPETETLIAIRAGAAALRGEAVGQVEREHINAGKLRTWRILCQSGAECRERMRLARPVVRTGGAVNGPSSHAPHAEIPGDVAAANR